MNDQWKFGRAFLQWNFCLSWLGILALIVGEFCGHDSPNIASMFGALALNLTGTIGFIIGGKATEHLVNTRWGADGSGESATLSENVGTK